jgi:hypothetical protein
MALVSVKSGDLLEAKVEAGKITFTPKSDVDRGIAESLADLAAGRSFGPCKTAKELLSSLHRESAKARSKNEGKTQTAEMIASYSKRFLN